MAQKEAIYQVDNGTGFDEIFFKTIAKMVQLSNGKSLQDFFDNGGEIGGTDGTKLKIDGRTITAIGEALALIGEGTSPLYYARNRTHNVDQLIPGGKGELGSDEARWQEIYLGNYSKNDNGYTKLPNGMILQWGLKAIGGKNSGDNLLNMSYPISFPNRVLSVHANITKNITTNSHAWQGNIKCEAFNDGLSNIGFYYYIQTTMDNYYDFEVNWFAIGY